VTVGDVKSEPSEYFGRTVVVSGDIDDLYTSSFIIGGEVCGGELLVIVPPDAEITGGRTGNQPSTDDDLVQVVGTVRQYVVADIESEFGLALDTDIEYAEQEPAVIAESIATAPWMAPDTTDAMGAMADVTTDMMN
jgi:hypothetical protein